MKKFLLIISMALSLLIIALPTYARKLGVIGTNNVNGIRFAYTTGNASFVYCNYEYYNLKTG